MDGRSFEPSWTTQSKGRPRWNRRRRADGSQGDHWDQRCGRHGPGYHPEMEALHRRHNARLRAIIAAHGWPGYSLVGEDGCRAAGSIVQHAILDPELQRRCVDLLSAAVDHGEAAPFMVALLADRVLVAEGQAQIYGTQYIGAPGGGVEPAPIADPQGVDERRRAIGLGPLVENTAQLTAQHRQETDARPLSPIIHDPSALSATERERRQTLAERLWAAALEMRDLPEGYAFRFPADAYPLAAEYVALERWCCPFVCFVVDLEPDADALWLCLTGRAGTKECLRAAPAPPRLRRTQGRPHRWSRPPRSQPSLPLYASRCLSCRIFVRRVSATRGMR